ncbi:hypothetical protein [Actinoplanes sp. NPDC026619]|uniref:hypothetical protein n=1 Tax=Actinoplanes sp. NPDC026619 TaxID=3155798 RepID=UPI0033D10654
MLGFVAMLLPAAGACTATRPHGRPAAAASPATSASLPRPPVPSGSTPYESAVFALRFHAAGIHDDDEQAWMDGIDPGNAALRERYQAVYRTLKSLGATEFKYDPGISKADPKDPSAITFPTRIWYCFGADTCRGTDPAEIQQVVTMKAVGGRWVIRAVTDKPDPRYFEPTPWEDGTLVLAQGPHVTAAAEPSEASFLQRVLPLAEKAAAADESFATRLLATQTRYRVYLAGEKQWKRWYGGDDDKWLVGLAVPISRYGTDVMLRIRELDSDADIQVTLQHEFAHVISLAGAEETRAADKWLSEGIAEYIGWSPKTATASLRMGSVRWQVSRRTPRSMIPKDPGRDGSGREGDAYYGLSHLAVDCMAQKYGQDRMLRFTRQVLLHGETYEVAARDAYGTSFAKVDTACTSWIRAHV